MKTILKFNGSNSPKQWSSSDNIHGQKEVFLDGVLSPNPFYFTIDMLAAIDGVKLLPATIQKKWGSVYNLDIVYNGNVIHSLSCGHDTSEYVAKVTGMVNRSRNFDVNDGILADIDSTYLTDFRTAAKITPYDYHKISEVLGLLSLTSSEYTGGSKSYPDGLPLPLSSEFAIR